MENNILIKKEKGYVLINEVQPIASTLSPNRGSKLSLKNCQEIELGYDLDKLSENHAEEVYVRNENDYNELANFENRKSNFEEGFKKALEILGDKKFSEEDIKETIRIAQNIQINEITNVLTEYKEPQILQMLNRQFSEWDVIVEMEEYLENNLSHIEGELPYFKLRQKLDEDGCLILKRK